MQYTVTYLLDGETREATVDAENAALAAQEAQDQALGTSTHEQFELIQVLLLDEVEEYTTPANDADFDPAKATLT